MKTQRWLLAALVMAAVLAYFVSLGKTPAGTQEPKTQDKDESVSSRRAAFIEAYNRGDAKAVAGFWTPDADYVDEDGHAYKGREAIEKLYEKVFAARKGAKLAIHNTASKMLTPDVMVNDGITEVTPADGGPSIASRFTAVLVRKDGEWYLQSVRDAAAQPPSNTDHFDDIEWLIGHWAGEADKGESATATYEWEDNQNFIVSEFATTVNGIPVIGGTQWIAWDAANKQIRSWSFYSRGGFGEAVWTKDGDKWVMRVNAQTAEGKKVSAVNIMTKIDDDHMTWQMTKLTVDGESLPDPKPVKLKRVQTDKP
jgi:uncharacterized protein (TIGR02246 family)